MSLDEGVSELIRRVYCAQQNLDEWDEIANQLMWRTGACAGFTTIVDLSNREYDKTRFYGSQDTKFARGLEEFPEIYAEDPSLAWAARNPAARFCDSSKTVLDVDYVAHPFVRWNRAHFGSTHWYVGYTAPRDRLSYSFSIHFPAGQGPGSAKAIALFRMLFEHIECAIHLAHRPFNPDSNRALLLLDSGGNVREVSNGARRTLTLPDGLSIIASRLTAALADEQATLDAALARAGSACSTGAASTAVRVSRPSGQRPHIITIRPMISVLGPFGRVHCELLVQIHDGVPHIGPLGLLQSLFDLTAREMQVVRLIADGHSVETLARCMGISTNTARTHLRAVFAKTQTSRQSELVQMCAGLAAS